MVVDYKELEGARLLLAEAADYNVRDFFKCIKKMSDKLEANQDKEDDSENLANFTSFSKSQNVAGKITEGTGHGNHRDMLLGENDFLHLLKFLKNKCSDDS